MFILNITIVCYFVLTSVRAIPRNPMLVAFLWNRLCCLVVWPLKYFELGKRSAVFPDPSQLFWLFPYIFALQRKNDFETSKEMFMHGIRNHGLVLSKKLFTHCWNETKKGTLQDENVTSIALWAVDFSSKGYKIELFLAKHNYP